MEKSKRRRSYARAYYRLSVLCLAAMVTARLILLMIDVIQLQIQTAGAFSIPASAAILVFTGWELRTWTGQDFNPRAPCGARQQKCTNHYAHFCDNRQISDAFAQNAACQGILLLFDAGKSCGFWVRTAQVISAHLCFAL